MLKILVQLIDEGCICLPVKVSQLKKEFLVEEKVVEIPQHLKQKITDEIIATLRGLDDNSNAAMQRGECTFISS